MARSWVLSSKAIADRVKNASQSATLQPKDSGTHLECPHCHHCIDVSLDCPNLPAGVKFDPSDTQLMEHLAAKCGIGSSKPQFFINEFIPTVEEDQGICYTHPENLPGAHKDGSSAHFFHRTMNAYSTGQRKRRRICNQDGKESKHVRWHKTGKTKAVIDNGVHKGWKKIMVLYKSSKKGMKPDRDNWVMHQYHLGIQEEEIDGEFVVSKIFYQQSKQQTDKHKEQDDLSLYTSPRTPTAILPDPPRSGKFRVDDDDVSIDDYIYSTNTMPPSPQEEKFVVEPYRVNPNPVQLEDEVEFPPWIAGESQAVEEMPNLAMGIQNFNSDPLLNNSEKKHFSITDNVISTNNDEVTLNNNDASYSLTELANLEFDTPPDITLLPDLQFGSQDSWFDRI